MGPENKAPGCGWQAGTVGVEADGKRLKFRTGRSLASFVRSGHIGTRERVQAFGMGFPYQLLDR